MSIPVFLAGTVSRRGGVHVLVPLDPARETIFVEPSAPLASPALRLWVTPPPVPISDGGGLEAAAISSPTAVAATSQLGGLEDASWEAVIEVLWPGEVVGLRERLERTRQLDNRVDMETDLDAWADLLAALLAWWQGLDASFRAARLRALQSLDPQLELLLSLPVPADAKLRGARTGSPPWESFPTLFLAPQPPRRTADEVAWNSWRAREATALLGPAGGLALLLGEGFEVRDGQIDMAEQVARVLERQEHLMAEAGTGIGKSVAYLAATLLHAARHGERVVVSTYTKALQHQLVEADLPLLTRLGYPGSVRLLLGRNNYLCSRQLRRNVQRPVEDLAQARAQLALALWARQSREGRRVELAEHPYFEAHWLSLFDSIEPCSPHICHRDPPCFVVAARRAAKEADVVVVNHSLLMMDLKSAQALLGPARLLVVDEAHELSDVATKALSHWISRERQEIYRNLAGERAHPGGLREVPAELFRVSVGTGVEQQLQDAAREADRALDAFANAYASWYSGVEASCMERLGPAHTRAGRHRYHDGDEAFGALRVESARLIESAQRLERALVELLDVSGQLAELRPEVDEEREGLASLLQLHRDLSASLRFCLAAGDEDWVYWFEWGGERGLAAIVAAPLTVEAPLAGLWNQHYQSVIMTSATLAVGDDFTPFAESVGFTKVARFTDTLVARSPFHYEEQALVLTTPELPAPDATEFPAAVARVVARIGQRVATKILVLSTSYQLIERLAQELGGLLPIVDDDLFRLPEGPQEPELLVQAPGADGGRLAERFRRAPAAILLATGSFWEGVDFPGRELEVLVVPRLPFAVPTEPLTEGRYERARRLGRDPFQDVALADAVLRLRQGVGRLLRSREDRGVVLLMDQRLQGRAYGVTFLQSMPRTCELVPSLTEMADRVVRFLRDSAAPSARRSGRSGAAEG